MSMWTDSPGVAILGMSILNLALLLVVIIYLSHLQKMRQSPDQQSGKRTRVDMGASVDGIGLAGAAGTVVERHQVASRPLGERVPVDQPPELGAVAGDFQVCKR